MFSYIGNIHYYNSLNTYSRGPLFGLTVLQVTMIDIQLRACSCPPYKMTPLTVVSAFTGILRSLNRAENKYEKKGYTYYKRWLIISMENVLWAIYEVILVVY